MAGVPKCQKWLRSLPFPGRKGTYSHTWYQTTSPRARQHRSTCRLKTDHTSGKTACIYKSQSSQSAATYGIFAIFFFPPLAQTPEHNRSLLWFKRKLFFIFFLNKEDITHSWQSSNCKLQVLKDSEGHTGFYPLMLVYIKPENQMKPWQYRPQHTDLTDQADAEIIGKFCNPLWSLQLCLYSEHWFYQGLLQWWQSKCNLSILAWLNTI